MRRRAGAVQASILSAGGQEVPHHGKTVPAQFSPVRVVATSCAHRGVGSGRLRWPVRSPQGMQCWTPASRAMGAARPRSGRLQAVGSPPITGIVENCREAFSQVRRLPRAPARGPSTASLRRSRSGCCRTSSCRESLAIGRPGQPRGPYGGPPCGPNCCGPPCGGYPGGGANPCCGTCGAKPCGGAPYCGGPGGGPNACG